MSKTLEFGFEGTRMRVDVPHSVMHRALAQDREFSRLISLSTKPYNTIEVRPHQDSTRLIFRTRKVGQYKEDGSGEGFDLNTKARQIVHAVNTVSGLASPTENDPHLEVEMSELPYNRSETRYSMYTEVSWPALSDTGLSESVARRMVATAQDLRIYSSSDRAYHLPVREMVGGKLQPHVRRNTCSAHIRQLQLRY